MPQVYAVQFPTAIWNPKQWIDTARYRLCGAAPESAAQVSQYFTDPAALFSYRYVDYWDRRSPGRPAYLIAFFPIYSLEPIFSAPSSLDPRPFLFARKELRAIV